jgi:hypothetical protein
MSRNTRASQSKKTANPPSPTASNPPVSSSSRRSHASPSPWATPTTNADKAVLQVEYEHLYDLVAKLKDQLIAADESAQAQSLAGRSLVAGLVSSSLSFSSSTSLLFSRLASTTSLHGWRRSLLALGSLLVPAS